LIENKLIEKADILYGFNGQEKDDGVKGEGNSYDFGERMYDNRLGRWLSVDPLARKYSEFSPYCFVANNPINLMDLNGRDIVPTILYHYEANSSYGIPYWPSQSSHMGMTVPSYGYQTNDNGTIDITINFNIYLSPILDNSHPGNSLFLDRNHPNLHMHIRLHESAHIQQKVLLAQTAVLNGSYNGKIYTGTANDIMNQAYTDFQKEYAANNGLSENMDDWTFDQQREFNKTYYANDVGTAPMQLMFGLVVKSLKNAENAMYQGTDPVTGAPNQEQDANNRANAVLKVIGGENAVPMGRLNYFTEEEVCGEECCEE
jgi:RHS repeat-associated protein